MMVVHPFRKKTAARCPVCDSSMYIVYWHNSTQSLMCMKCHFGFNYRS